MTTDREAACWLMAALLVVVLTFSATGCGLHHQTAGLDEPAFVAAAPTVTLDRSATKPTPCPNWSPPPSCPVSTERDRAAALGFEDVLLGDPVGRGAAVHARAGGPARTR